MKEDSDQSKLKALKDELNLNISEVLDLKKKLKLIDPKLQQIQGPYSKS